MSWEKQPTRKLWWSTTPVVPAFTSVWKEILTRGDLHSTTTKCSPGSYRGFAISSGSGYDALSDLVEGQHVSSHNFTCNFMFRLHANMNSATKEQLWPKANTTPYQDMGYTWLETKQTTYPLDVPEDREVASVLSAIFIDTGSNRFGEASGHGHSTRSQITQATNVRKGNDRSTQ